MLDIEYKGGNTIVLKTKGATVVVDPKRSVVGGEDVSVKGAVELATEARFALDNSSSDIILEGPGEYEVKDFSVHGMAAQRHIDTKEGPLKSTLYRVEANGINIAVIGNVAIPLSEDQLEGLGVIDILVVPVGGGGYTLDATAAVSVVRAVDPRAVIPVHYHDSALTYEVPQAGVDEFISELGAPVEKTDKYRLKTLSALPEALTTIEVTRTA